MKVLISWSGKRSRELAIAVSRFVKLVLQATDPWMSDKDIASGSFWHQELWDELTSAKAAIICVTPEMVSSTWVHFEAGAIAKQLTKTCVCPYLFKLHPSNISGPLAFLQCNVADKEGTEKLLADVNASLGKQKLPDEIFKQSFKVNWDDFEKELKRIEGIKIESQAPEKRPVSEVLEEVLAGVRDLQARMQIPKFTPYPGEMIFSLGKSSHHGITSGPLLPIDPRHDCEHVNRKLIRQIPIYPEPVFGKVGEPIAMIGQKLIYHCPDCSRQIEETTMLKENSP